VYTVYVNTYTGEHGVDSTCSVPWGTLVQESQLLQELAQSGEPSEQPLDFGISQYIYTHIQHTYTYIYIYRPLDITRAHRKVAGIQRLTLPARGGALEDRGLSWTSVFHYPCAELAAKARYAYFFFSFFTTHAQSS